jgi:hypothetical protein
MRSSRAHVSDPDRPEHERGKSTVHAPSGADHAHRADRLLRARGEGARRRRGSDLHARRLEPTISREGSSTFMVEMAETAALVLNCDHAPLARDPRRSRDAARAPSTGSRSPRRSASTCTEDRLSRALRHALPRGSARSRRRGPARSATTTRARASTRATWCSFIGSWLAAANRSYGVAVARIAGLPEDVVARARTLLAGLEERSERREARPRSSSRSSPRRRSRRRRLRARRPSAPARSNPSRPRSSRSSRRWPSRPRRRCMPSRASSRGASASARGAELPGARALGRGWYSARMVHRDADRRPRRAARPRATRARWIQR